MLSDSIFDNTYKLLEEVVWYMTCDRHHLEEDGEELFYDLETYVEVLERMIPLRDMQYALDVGCDPQPLDDEIITYWERRIVEEILDILPEQEAEWQEAFGKNGKYTKVRHNEKTIK